MSYDGNLMMDMLRERSDPRRKKAFMWSLQNLDKIEWVGDGSGNGERKCSVCLQKGHNKRTCITRKENEFIAKIQP